MGSSHKEKRNLYCSPVHRPEGTAPACFHSWWPVSSKALLLPDHCLWEEAPLPGLWACTLLCLVFLLEHEFFLQPGKQMMVCSKRVMGGESPKGLFTKMWAGWGNQEKMMTLQRHSEVPLPPLWLEGQRRAGPPQHCVLWSGDWTGTMGQETTRGISALVFLLLLLNLLLLAKFTWKPSLAFWGTEQGWGGEHVDWGSERKEKGFPAHSVFLFLTQNKACFLCFTEMDSLESQEKQILPIIRYCLEIH